MLTLNNTTVTSYDDPLFEQINAELDKALDELAPFIPRNPTISRDDEWNDPMFDYENFVIHKECSNAT